MSKIIDVATELRVVPLDPPVEGSGIRIPATENVIVHVTTDDGIIGSGYVWATYRGASGVIEEHTWGAVVQAAVHYFASAVVGCDVFEHERIFTSIFEDNAQTTFRSGGGFGAFAYSGIDLAVWDALCKTLGQPLYRVLGASRDSVPVYTNELIQHWGDPIDEIAAHARRLVAEGFAGLKMPGNGHRMPGEVGEGTARGPDLARIRAVREAVGDDVNLMVDARSLWTYDEARRVGRELDELGLFWLEDPVPESQAEQLLKLNRDLTTPIATGEKGFSYRTLAEMARLGCMDVVIFEPGRIGGVTGAVKLAALLEADNVPVCSHTYPYLGAQLLAAFPNGHYGEFLAWWDALIEEPAEQQDGRLKPSDRPGTGYQLKRETAGSAAAPSLQERV